MMNFHLKNFLYLNIHLNQKYIKFVKDDKNIQNVHYYLQNIFFHLILDMYPN